MSRFNDRFQKIWECLSTDVMGNSQPTAGVFSGDNFAQGDMRVPTPLIGGMQRRDAFGGKKKKKRRPVREGFLYKSHYLEDEPECPVCRGKTERCRGYAHGHPCVTFRCNNCGAEGTREDLEARAKGREH